MGKPKNRQRTIPQQLPSTNPVDLFLLAGLPNPLHQRIETFFQSIAGANAKIIAHPSGSFDGDLYKKNNVDLLLSAAARFAIRRLKNRSDDQSARPRRIALFYVPAQDDNALLSAFDFFVFPVPLRDLTKFDDRGYQLRHQRQSCEDAVRHGMTVYKQELIGLVQQRIESRKPSEALILPPLNFHLEGQRAKDSFSELTRGSRPWQNAFPDGVSPERFDKDRLPSLRHQETRFIYRDSRGVVFPCARASEAHGGTEFDHEAKIEVLRDVLQTIYRFGAALPTGFHHDAQFEGGRHFKDMPFDCSKNGALSVTSSHANIYPNDYVRA
jgi:hypothetical protein